MPILNKSRKVVNEYILDFPIIRNGNGWQSSEKDNLSIIESGERKILLSKVVSMIRSAKEFICLQSFLIQDTIIIDELLKAITDRNVKVYILSSAEARLKNEIEEEPDFIKSKYIDLLEKKFKNNFIHRCANNFHAKYIMVDPHENGRGMLLTSNFTNNGFFYSPELAIELSQNQISELFKVFVYHFWEHATDEQTDQIEFAKIKPANKFSLPPMVDILLTSPNASHSTLNTTLLKSIKNAKQSIAISTYILSLDTDLIKELLIKAKAGLIITLYCRSIKWLYTKELQSLSEAGVNIYMHPKMHAKSLLIDNKEAYIFTTNLIINGLVNGFEIGTKLTDEQTKDLIKIHEAWTKHFPSKIIASAKITELNNYYHFQDDSLIEVSLKDWNKEPLVKKQNIKTVNELIQFFEQKLAVPDQNYKNCEYQLQANIDPKPGEITQPIEDVITITKRILGKKEEDVVIISKKFNPDSDLSKLKGFEKHRLYINA